MIRRASLELLVRGLLGDGEAPPPPKKTEDSAGATGKSRRERETTPWLASASPAPEFVLC